MSSLRRVLFGRDPFAAVAGPLVGLLVGGLLWQTDPSLVEAYTLVPDEHGDWLLLAAFVGLPALLSYWNDGLVVCWLWDFGPLFAVFLARFAGGVGAGGDPYGALYAALALSALGALLWGTAGFLLGMTLRRFVGGVRTRWRWRAVG